MFRVIFMGALIMTSSRPSRKSRTFAGLSRRSARRHYRSSHDDHSKPLSRTRHHERHEGVRIWWDEASTRWAFDGCQYFWRRQNCLNYRGYQSKLAGSTGSGGCPKHFWIFCWLEAELVSVSEKDILES